MKPKLGILYILYIMILHPLDSTKDALSIHPVSMKGYKQTTLKISSAKQPSLAKISFSEKVRGIGQGGIGKEEIGQEGIEKREIGQELFSFRDMLINFI